MKFHAGDYFFFFDDEKHPTAAWVLGRVTKSYNVQNIYFDGIIWTEEGFGMRISKNKRSWMHSESSMVETARKVSTSHDKQAVIKRILK